MPLCFPGGNFLSVMHLRIALKTGRHGLTKMKFLLKFSGFILTAFFAGCASSADSRPPEVFDRRPPSIRAETKEEPPPAAETREEPRPVADVFVEGDALTQGDYSVVKLKKKVKIERTPGLTEVSYAVLKRKDKVLAEFDGVYFGLGNATDFGLFSFLGGKTRQLIVSQTVPRGGRHWIVDLSPDFRVIYDSADYAVGREDLLVLDIDKDGRFEVLQEVTDFYGFGNFNSAETPLPLVIFKYDEKAGKYLPANRLFKKYALHDIDAEINKPGGRALSDLLDIMLRYVFAGEAEKAWALFDKEYRDSDKADVKAAVSAVLRKNAVYNFIYGKSRTK